MTISRTLVLAASLVPYALAQKAVLTQDADNPARQPFAVALSTTSGTLCGLLTGDATFTVPTGKRLVIEQISAELQVATGVGAEATVILPVPGSGGTKYRVFPLTTFHGQFPTVDLYRVNHVARIYVDGGQEVRFRACQIKDFVPATLNSELSVSGYYINVP
jgi:hypothetical protein